MRLSFPVYEKLYRSRKKKSQQKTLISSINLMILPEGEKWAARAAER